MVVVDRRQRGVAVAVQAAQALPERSYISVYTRIKRLTAPVARGTWSAAEDKALLAAHAHLGAKWTRIGGSVGRSGQACRDRWRVIGQVPGRNTGPWSAEEEERLARIVSQQVRGVLRSVLRGVLRGVPDRPQAGTLALLPLPFCRWGAVRLHRLRRAGSCACGGDRVSNGGWHAAVVAPGLRCQCMRSTWPRYRVCVAVANKCSAVRCTVRTAVFS